MEIFSLFNLIILAVVASVFQTDGASANSNSPCGGIFESDSGDFEYYRENSGVDDGDLTGSSVCVWMIKLLKADGISLKLEDLDENSVVNLYAEGEPTDPVSTSITLNSTQINSAVELSGRILIITLKSGLGQLGNSSTKLSFSWSSLPLPLDVELSKAQSKLKGNGSKVLPVEITSTGYFGAGGEKGRYAFKNFYSYQKSVWILDTGSIEGVCGNLDAEVKVQFDPSCQSKPKSKSESGSQVKSLCECSYFGLFEIVQSTGKLRLVNEFCGRSASTTLNKLSTQLVLFIYATDPNSGSGSEESIEISWGRSKETTNPTITTTTTMSTTTTELPTSPKPPLEASACPQNSTISPCFCTSDRIRVFIHCQGSDVNQTWIETAFSETRRANGIPEGRGIYIYEFEVKQTNLTQLDLAPFYASQMDYLAVINNKYLTKLMTSGNPQDYGSIHVNTFYLESSPLNREGFGDTLKYFSNDMNQFLTYVIPFYNVGEEESEFLPGLSAHTNLKYLYLQVNNMYGRLNSESCNFKQLSGLQLISVESNRINEIGGNVFDFDVDGGFLDINIVGNKLNGASFHPNSGISRVNRETKLDIRYNQIATLPPTIFETFLDANPQNELWLEGNPLICDERASWLKSRRDELESRVMKADCSNDEGHTVFDSNLIP